MNNRLRLSHALLAVLALAALALATAGAAASAPPTPQAPAVAKPNVAPSSYVAAPPVTWISSAGGGTPCGGNAVGVICYTPHDMDKIYDVPASATGAGQTIIIVDAFGNATLQSDLAQFDFENALPDPSLTILGPNGKGNPNDPDVQGWQVETNLDVEWAHGMAPKANIVLSIASSDNAHDLTNAVQRALGKYPGAIVSQSFGADETFVKRGFIDDLSAHRVYAAASGLGDTVIAATGDFGASGDGDTGIVAWYPATDPLVTAIGGTQGADDLYTIPNGPYAGLTLEGPYGLQNNAGGYGAEETWNEVDLGGGATGGAPSQLFPAPLYQQGVTGYSKRTVPDVALNASENAGALVVFQGMHGVIGGTSASTAEWAGVLALVNQVRAAAGNGPLGPANTALYAVDKAHPDAFHDITVGNNTFDPEIPGFSAGPGYDLTTGLGSPDVAKLLGYLANVPGAPVQSRLMDVRCQNQQLTGSYRNVQVQRGSYCDLLNATVQGNVQAEGASGISIVGTTISGDLHIHNTTGAGDPLHLGLNVICNSIVLGNGEVQNSSPLAPFSVGGRGCASSADITGNIGSVFGNDLHYDNNASTTSDVSNNTVFGNLECNHNGAVGGGGNQAGRLTGQCSGTLLPQN